ncbi:MAG: 4Fe-4S binding protein [Sulfitobacter litoralis]|jgi:ferredoxin|uniref:4Fe-4S binding protein n=1 Tax=Sulfitobacter TaxID=60136 RepID=UPI001B4B67B2|nr:MULTISPECIES: 4Fe-4S binding protein [Sulfitobacter]MBQ0765979.1 4Fe-4S binding protein [Sulfitobacter litoralis]MCF7727656.1 4Fe-4S dicluster domain-containing protein [Sulfitobacter sp. M22]MCF7776132.1 4Fe-4S dicluster domain-containing protein [Sulfitobacter sp. M220]|tara:strand:- start:887 stop:2839 length:1953 start_codon:yes stop_codon:yes gene_type:complete
MEKTFLLCDCLGSQDIDAPALSKATGLPCSKVYTCLCTDQIGIAAEAMAAGDTVIACQQERPRFEELAAEIEADVPEFVDIRDRAGWHDDKGDATPKMAALLAEQQLAAPAPRVLDVVSEGTCLIMAPPALALEVAETVADTLAVTVLWQGDYDTAVDPRFDVVKGDLRKASGALGNFNLTFDQLQMLIPGGRGAPSFTAPRDGAKSQCDIILDLTGNTSLFPAPHKRDGYLRADPGSKPAVAEAVREAMQMVGTFEKPLYVRLTKSLCAHSRAEQPACSNCLDLCPTGAITSAGEHVAIDPMICAGCGSCSAVCPSGAITYDAPPVDTLFRRVSTLASTYRKAGGNAPRLLVHDEDHGAEMIRLYARFGAGLPVDVIPLAVDALAGFGHAEMLAALGCGFAHVDVLLSPRTERDVIEVQAELARAISGTDTIRLIDVADPDALETALVTETLQPAHDTLLPLGTRRQVARLAGKTLQPEAKVIDLPDAAPYGAVLVDTDACTLCLSCVSLCPSGALGDNPDLPQLRFQEDACLQCGLCANICPEDAITLKPQLNLTAQAFTQVVLHEEEPFACIECGSLFGVKSTVEKITEKLAGKHAMFASSEAAKMIQMCDNCRINAQYHAQNNPLAGKERPRVRTSEDYFSKRKDH